MYFRTATFGVLGRISITNLALYLYKTAQGIMGDVRVYNVAATAPCIYAVILPDRLEGVKLLGTEQEPSAVLDFEQRLRQAWSGCPGLSDASKCQHIFDHLGDFPRQELDCHPAQALVDPDSVFKVLHSAFGDRRTWCEILHHLTGLSQLPGETVRLFSHRLIVAWGAVQHAQVQRQCQIVNEVLLLEVFICGILDPLLQSLLREDLFTRPETSFSTLRERAIRMEVPVCSELPAQSTAVLDMCVQIIQRIEAVSADMQVRKQKPKRRRRRRRRVRLTPPAASQPPVSPLIAPITPELYRPALPVTAQLAPPAILAQAHPSVLPEGVKEHEPGLPAIDIIKTNIQWSKAKHLKFLRKAKPPWY